MRIFITGTAGFIGYHLAKKMLDLGHEVIGFDNINAYYDIELKYARLGESGIDAQTITSNRPSTYKNYTFIKGDLTNKPLLEEVFAKFKPDFVCNLAAQAGVRYSLTNPHSYVDSNIVGFVNLLEVVRHFGKIKHFVFASSSSVYGLNKDERFSTRDNVNHPISLYAASKRSNELMAHSYSHLFGIKATGLRFFTVYGPWGRPDMALFLFTKAILEQKPIKVFNNGEMVRDFTYISDIIDGIVRVIDAPPSPDPSRLLTPDSSTAAFKIYNIGNSSAVPLMDFIRELENQLGMEAKKELLPLQAGDVPATSADVSDLSADLGYEPKVGVQEGIKNFVSWYRYFYKV